MGSGKALVQYDISYQTFIDDEVNTASIDVVLRWGQDTSVIIPWAIFTATGTLFLTNQAIILDQVSVSENHLVKLVGIADTGDGKNFRVTLRPIAPIDN